MTALALKLADIFRIHGPAYLAEFGQSLSAQQKRALRDISLCRTAALAATSINVMNVPESALPEMWECDKDGMA